jgi:hypothetical protein
VSEAAADAARGEKGRSTPDDTFGDERLPIINIDADPFNRDWLRFWWSLDIHVGCCWCCYYRAATAPSSGDLVFSGILPAAPVSDPSSTLQRAAGSSHR